MSEQNPILNALCAASEPLGDTIDEITAPDGRRHFVPANDTPGMHPAQAPEPPSGFHTGEGTHTNALAAKVAATNRANHAVVLLQRYVAQRLRPFIGQKVLKQTNWGMTLTKKVSEYVGEIKCDRAGEHFHISAQGAWISVRLSVSRCYKENERRESSSSYEAYASVGKVDCDILTELVEPPKLRTDYTEAEIRGKRAQLKLARDQVSRAESALEGFGEYDR